MENYTIYDEVGRGTQSFVYKARRKRSIEYVAVKSTAKSRMDKILNEVQLLHKLDSRFVLKFYNWYESQNHIWLIFEYCIGGDLLNLITQDRRLPASAVRTFGWELVAGLQYLHANNILYCDLKPANVLIDECGSLKLADFGLARRIPTRDSILAKPLAPGSPNYMAPELFQPAAIHSFASDFWALGCVLYELCTGRPPFTHTFFPELARIIQTEPLVIPQEGYVISPDFADLLQRLLEKDPYKRITWPELLSHPFWEGCTPLEDVEFPPQELFEASRPQSLQELGVDSLSIAIPTTNKDDHPVTLHQAGEASPTTESVSDSSDFERDDVAAAVEELIDDRHSEAARGLRREEMEPPTQPTKAESKIRPVTAPAILKDDSRVKVGASTMQRATKTASQGGERSDVKSRPSHAMSRATLKKASRLLYVASDNSVKPIAFCQDIENNSAPQVVPDMLDFDPMTAEMLLACTTEDLEDHLKSIYISLKSPELNMPEKRNVLAHLFSLCLQPRLANVIVNSSLLSLLIKMLHHHAHGSSSSGNVHHDTTEQVCLVLGVLFRFATFVSSTSPETLQLLLATLNTLVSSPNSHVAIKRKAMACFGEVLFYLTTQQGETVSSSGLTHIVEGLQNRDLTSRHYALRTVTNILTQCSEQSVPDTLLSDQVVTSLVQCVVAFRSREHELLQTSSVQALSQFIRHVRLFSSTTSTRHQHVKSATMTVLSGADVLSALWEGASRGHESTNLTVSSLTVLNAYLELSTDKGRESDVHSIVFKSRTVLLSEVVGIQVLKRLLEVRSKFEEDSEDKAHTSKPTVRLDRSRRYTDGDQTAPVLIRAKAMLFTYFGIQRSLEFARKCIRENVLDKVEQAIAPYESALLVAPRPESPPSTAEASVVSESSRLSAFDQYGAQCGLNLVRLCIRTALKMSAECIASNNKIDYEDEATGDGIGGQSTVASEPFQLFEQLLRNATCRLLLCSYFVTNEGKEFTFFIRLVSKLLAGFSTARLTATGTTVGSTISRILLRLFKSSPRDAAVLVASETQEIFSHLLPAIVVQLQQQTASSGNEQSQDDDEDESHYSANCIQLVYLIMLHLDVEFAATGVEWRDRFVHDHLLPCFSALFGPAHLDENVWRFAIELLYGLVSRSEGFLDKIEIHGLVGPVLSILSAPKAHHFNTLPSSATSLIRALTERAKEKKSFGTLYSNQIARHLTDGLEFNVTSRTIGATTTDLLEALYLLLYNRYEELRQSSDTRAPANFDSLVYCGPLLLVLCAYGESTDTETDPDCETSVVIEHEILEIASRCLIFLSQIFGARLCEALFSKSPPEVAENDPRRALCVCLQLTQHPTVRLRMLLTVKNCLRCEKRNDSSLTRRWLMSDRTALSVVTRISKASPSSLQESDPTHEQTVKASTEIVQLIQSSQNR